MRRRVAQREGVQAELGHPGRPALGQQRLQGLAHLLRFQRKTYHLPLDRLQPLSLPADRHDNQAPTPPVA